MRVIAGDLGGTKTLLMIAECDTEGCRSIIEQRYSSNDFTGLEQMVLRFLSDTGTDATTIEAACFGVAGPVTRSADQVTAQITALPWQLNAAALSRETGIHPLTLINDFEAIGYGIEALTEDDLVELQAGDPQPKGTRAVIGAGTGLGIGLLLHDGEHYRPLPSEGGHAEFAPTGELQRALQHYLETEYEHVSWDRVLSGPGLHAIYRFLTTQPKRLASATLNEAITTGDPSAEISRFAIEQNDPLALEALGIFIAIYGAQAGNVALTLLPRGGLYIAGGIAPKLIEQLQQPRFIKAFHSKGRMADLMHKFPINVVMEPRVGLLGAALHASRL
ncbi:glucokinase [Solemya pervernicosa gill symbiont]|uniref:Glucokinase n=2 Tax=Gammaproteobacteria incertae sedis TaxID=118884 RepID=A0A1T2L149_9GAMM|nr:glucokinase [Candidatus Reidiella endopervernicosa]OOZ38794.1 glucokinase [Solemya pervernicosa gill symbiont]QKQ25924.1 glucokinase [Candidatus Reidiella endopervernicosa]